MVKVPTEMNRHSARIYVEELARTNEPLNGSVSLSAQMLYYTLRGIYRAYSAGEITREQGAQAKRRALADYDSVAMSEEIYHEQSRRMVEISRVLCDAEKCGCEYCKEVSRIFDGRQRFARV